MVELVEMMIKDGWDAVKGLTIKEKMMPTAMKIEDLKDCDGKPLDLSKGDIRENDLDEDYPSEPPTFEIQTIAQLQEWDKAGRPVPENSHNSGNETSHKHRDLKHPDDPLGLVADKLGRAIADERRENGSPTGKKLEPCFAHVYSLGHASVMKQLDKGLEFLGCGAFHAACEVYGVEWSYGYNDEDASGIFPSPPKYCEMHDYKESHYIGDTTLTPEEFERWLQFLSSMDYKQEDPLDPAFPKRVPNVGETPAEFFGSAMHPTYTDQLNPITKEADIGEKYDHHDTSRMWTEFVSEDEEKIITRVGWWGDEYNLLNNNCCFLSDHLLKITCGKPLPHWIFSLAKVGDGIMHGAHFVPDSGAEGMHVLLKGVGSVAQAAAAAKGKQEEEAAAAAAKAREQEEAAAATAAAKAKEEEEAAAIAATAKAKELPPAPAASPAIPEGEPPEPEQQQEPELEPEPEPEAAGSLATFFGAWLPQLKGYLEELGVEEAEDLKELEAEDIEVLVSKLKKVQGKKLRKKLAAFCHGSDGGSAAAAGAASPVAATEPEPANDAVTIESHGQMVEVMQPTDEFDLVFSNKTASDTLCLTIRAQLVASGVRVWQQQTNIPKDSENWFSEWYPSAVKSRKIVCFISADYLKSPYCMKEWRVAESKNKLLVVACEPQQVPMRRQLPRHRGRRAGGSRRDSRCPCRRP